MAGGPFIRPLVPRSRRFAAPLTRESRSAWREDSQLARVEVGDDEAHLRSYTDNLSWASSFPVGGVEPIRAVASNSSANATVDVSLNSEAGLYLRAPDGAHSAPVASRNGHMQVSSHSGFHRAPVYASALTEQAPAAACRSKKLPSRSRSRTIAVQTDCDSHQLKSTAEAAVQVAVAHDLQVRMKTRTEDLPAPPLPSPLEEPVVAELVEHKDLHEETSRRMIAELRLRSKGDFRKGSPNVAATKIARLQRSASASALRSRKRSLQRAAAPKNRSTSLVTVPPTRARVARQNNGLLHPGGSRREEGLAGDEPFGRRIHSPSSLLSSQPCASPGRYQSHDGADLSEAMHVSELLNPLSASAVPSGCANMLGADALLVPGLDAATLELEKLISDTHKTLVADGFLDGSTAEPVASLGHLPADKRHATSALAPSSLDLVDKALEELQLGLEEIDRVLDNSNVVTNVAA